MGISRSLCACICWRKKKCRYGSRLWLAHHSRSTARCTFHKNKLLSWRIRDAVSCRGGFGTRADGWRHDGCSGDGENLLMAQERSSTLRHPQTAAVLGFQVEVLSVADPDRLNVGAPGARRLGEERSVPTAPVHTARQPTARQPQRPEGASGRCSSWHSKPRTPS